MIGLGSILRPSITSAKKTNKQTNVRTLKAFLILFSRSRVVESGIQRSPDKSQEQIIISHLVPIP